MSQRADADIVYLDYAATTPLADEARAAMHAVWAGADAFGNPSSLHAAGCRSAALIEDSRAAVAELIAADPGEIVFTSGATEADNLALRGGIRFRAHRGRHLVTVATEHKAVLETARALGSDGFELDIITPRDDGRVTTDMLADVLRDDTQLVSVMHINNETGVVQDIAALGALCRERGILFHCDAAQSAGKLPIDVEAMSIDLLSISAHKMYGPQGVGALYVANRGGCGVDALQTGGSQERGLRAGTVPVALIAGFAAAARECKVRMAADLAHATELHNRLWTGIADLPGLQRNGSVEHAYAGILNVSIAAAEGESLLFELAPVCVASGSACNARSGDASFVLRAMGRSDLEAQGALRLSFGRYTTAADIDAAITRLRAAVIRLIALAAPEDVT